jgi:hypothetical protein
LRSAGGKQTEPALKRRKQTEIFERLVYGSSPARDGKRQKNALWEIASISTINGDAFVIIEKVGSFFYIPRRFFDRSGWDYDDENPPIFDETDEELRIDKISQEDIENFFSRNINDDDDDDDDDNEEEDDNDEVDEVEL